MKKTAMIGTLALLLVGLVAAGAFAFPFGNGKGENIRSAISAGDYEAYKTAYTANMMNETQFSDEVSRYQEREQNRAQMEEKRQAVEDAISAGDYDAWLAAIEGSPMADKLKEVITEDNFATFVEMHNAMAEKDFDTAKTLSEEIGLDTPIGMGFGGPGMGMRDHGMEGRGPASQAEQD